MGPLFWLGLIATAWCAYFFRDPVRVTPDDPALVVSPADGLVVATAERVPPPSSSSATGPALHRHLHERVRRARDLHAAAGTVVRRYHAGKFLNASFDKASDENERQSFKIRTPAAARSGWSRSPVSWRGGSSPSSRRVRAGRRPAGRADPLRQPLRRLPAGGGRAAGPGRPADLAGETVLADLFGNQPKRQGRAG